MAKRYGTTPANLLKTSLLDWSINSACFNAGMTERQKFINGLRRKRFKNTGEVMLTILDFMQREEA